MTDDTHSQRSAQLDKAEREQLETVVAAMHERIESNVRFQLSQLGLDSRSADVENADDHEGLQELVEAIEREAAADQSWDDAFEQYVTGVGYTVVNRLAALRCMELRGFIDEEVTQFKQNGLTPAAERLVHDEFLLEGEALLRAYREACNERAAEIEILFDRSTAYSLIEPDVESFEALCGMLDSLSDAVWRADDVLGWVYEYYNVKLLDELRQKGNREGFDPEDVPPANQFYTPHWVVRMLTDNSLGKLYLEHTGELQAAVDAQEALSPDERKHRPLSPDDSPEIAEFCTYLVDSATAGDSTDFDHPRELRVIDPACGSGHFLLYAFDVLERIWRAETELSHAEIPTRIIRHNLYGVDLDLRACQLAAFNLYLKGRSRTEAEGGRFEMPQVGIVCADTSVAEIDGVEAVFEDVAGDDQTLETALRQLLDDFEEVDGLGSLLDVHGTLGELFEDTDSPQSRPDDDRREHHTLGELLSALREAVDDHRHGESFVAQELRSVVRLLGLLAQEYDVTLMNPPYGSRKRMPDGVQAYIEDHYSYYPEYYISFVETCRQRTRSNGRIGVLMPRSFMFKKSFEEFRQDFVEHTGAFEFVAEFGLGILDNATVRTVGTVLKVDHQQASAGTFLRLHDLNAKKKERAFLSVIAGGSVGALQRVYTVQMAAFLQIPTTPISYYTPQPLRELHETEQKLDADMGRISGKSVATIATGLQTGNNDRFLRKHWETSGDSQYKPYAKGGRDAWIAPGMREVVDWRNDGAVVRRAERSVLRNEQHYGHSGLTWTYIKDTGRRFGYLPSGCRFDVAGSMLFADDVDTWALLAALNSELYHALVVSLTPERQWNQGDIGRLPWLEALDDATLQQLAKQQYQTAVTLHGDDPTSPFYSSPLLYPSAEWFYDHPFSDHVPAVPSQSSESAGSETLAEKATKAAAWKQQRREQLDELARAADEHIYEAVGIDESVQQRIRQEISLRTACSDREEPTAADHSVEAQIKDLVHHFTLQAIREKPDGIIPVHSIEGQPTMHDEIVERFHTVYGEHAEKRLIETDEQLGTTAANEEPYPNLRAFIETDLFEYHVDRMENTPIVWKLTTDRLLADATGEGFACFLDYHSLDGGLFDRLSSQYLEPRKADLRKRRSAADRRRNDDLLPTAEQVDAANRYDRCVSGLDQIAAFEDVIQELGTTTPRVLDDQTRQQVDQLAPKVAAFRKETHDRLETLAELNEHTGEAWFEDTFSPTFWETVETCRGEWLDGLSALEAACRGYAGPPEEPPEAHLADLFEYFSERLKGSAHYASLGILFVTYYFEREGSHLLDDGHPQEQLTADERRLASLAMGVADCSVVDDDYLAAIAENEGVAVAELPPLAEFTALANEIDDRCQVISSQISSEWADRALREITTAGYQPKQKHGVAINITPLADAEIVPMLVDQHVI